MPTLSKSSSRTIPWFSGTATSATLDLFTLSLSVGTANFTAAVPALIILAEQEAHLSAPLSGSLFTLGLAGPEPHASKARIRSCQLLVLVNVGDHSGQRLRASLWETPLKPKPPPKNALLIFDALYSILFFPDRLYTHLLP